VSSHTAEVLSELGFVALQVALDLHFQTLFASNAKSLSTNL